MISRFITFLGRSVAYLYLAALVVGAVVATWGSLRPVPTETSSPVVPRHPRLLLADAVRKVNADASLLMLSPAASFGLDEPTACKLARQAAARQNFAASALKKWNSECALGTMMREATDPVFQAIATSGALPPDAYAFDAFVGLEEEWHTLGLFADFEACARMMEAAMSLGFGARSCLPWAPRF